jgi:hypothetical protein
VDGSLLAQAVLALIAAGAVYGGIRSDLRAMHESIERIERAAERAHHRLDNCAMGRRCED